MSLRILKSIWGRAGAQRYFTGCGEEFARTGVTVSTGAHGNEIAPCAILTIICFMPVVVVFILRVIAPGYAIAYSSFCRCFILLLGWGFRLGLTGTATACLARLRRRQ